MKYNKSFVAAILGLALFALAPARADVSMETSDGASTVDTTTSSSDGSGSSMSTDGSDSSDGCGGADSVARC